MAGTRTVYRGSKGQFAGAKNGKAETVKSGGFANAAFRARVASAPRASRSTSAGRLAKGRSKSLTKAGKVAVVAVAGAGAHRKPVTTAVLAVGIYKASRAVQRRSAAKAPTRQPVRR